MIEVEPFRLEAGVTLLDHLCGIWSVERSLQDHASGLSGAFAGTAVFTYNDGGALRHGERGSLRWAGSTPTLATRELLWRPTGSALSAEVCFPDGRLFHCLDLATGEDSPAHQCAPDVYWGEFVLEDQDQWRYTWHVEGPQKNLTLVTSLTRAL
ncbi:DUF6314 family protein [Arthrobacter sp. H20]|uniref:DUF6314 family protein n=1 Tax=Arthrobacter sp. H20 TaxID=1267981 RepID=UPI0004B7533A|nr:DUF6314 family protein [Arthrobacter sp. H20]